MTGNAIPRFQPLRILETLHRHEVRYVLIGGLAATLYGSPLTTADADLCPAGDPTNLARLSAALQDLDARVYSADSPRGLRFDIAAETLAQANIWNLITDAGRVDISFRPSGTGGYPDLVKDVVAFELRGFTVPVASLRDVIRSKEAAGRERDRQALPTLRRLLEKIEEG